MTEMKCLSKFEDELLSLIFVVKGVYCVQKLNLPASKVNPRGGAMSVFMSISEHLKYIIYPY